jgi:hypothetical protein
VVLGESPVTAFAAATLPVPEPAPVLAVVPP